jgi:hypothetical protein
LRRQIKALPLLKFASDSSQRCFIVLAIRLDKSTRQTEAGTLLIGNLFTIIQDLVVGNDNLLWPLSA